MQLPETVQALLAILLMCFGTILTVPIVQPLENIPQIQISDEHLNNSRQKRDNNKIDRTQKDVLMHLVVDNTVSPVLTTDPEKPLDIWKLSNDKFTKKQKFANYTEGTAIIQKSGFYVIYAEVQLVNPPRLKNWYWYTIKINGREFLRCMREQDFWKSRITGCRASEVVYLTKNIKVTFHSKEMGKEVASDSFWGLVKIKKGSRFLRKLLPYNP